MNLHSLGPLVTFPSLEGLTTLDSPAPLALDDRVVHVWGFSLNGSAQVLSCCRTWLNEEERAKAARFIRQEDRTRYLLAHGGLRALLARYTGFAPAALKFQTGSVGKPALLDQQGRPHELRFNLSHSHGRMLIAVAQEQEVGVDLEEIRDRVDAVKLAKRFYAPSEYRELLDHSWFDQVQQFYRYWVAKEAVLKGQGVGILSLCRCEILAPLDGARSQIRLSDGAALQPGWSIQWLACGSGWQGAVALQGMDWSVRVQTVEEV